ncbi:MAG: T9SS type A sorting domain-containing protein, partial [Saprospiraceae bacterium]|nr:T9SS type A sorting domain-containing protein [Saprospiraceae bacterium]
TLSEFTQQAVSSEDELAIFPNPFAKVATIRFKLLTTENVSLIVFNPQGIPVRKLYTGTLKAGDHQWQWKGNDFSGNSLPSGMYVVQLRYADQVINRRVILQQ